ncbi:hypothetical protein DAPPUDRAFT_343365, partial [Daphnia pulex]
MGFPEREARAGGHPDILVLADFAGKHAAAEVHASDAVVVQRHVLGQVRGAAVGELAVDRAQRRLGTFRRAEIPVRQVET